jgi:mRNA-degrading endonuclease toxin of MazEF toxin-antitoxin module
MRLSVTYRRWDVVAVDYPFLEGADSKRRPAVVVSTEALREESGVYWLMMITTAKAGVRRGDIAVSDPAKAGLPEQCVIRPARLTTLSDAQIARRIGTLSMKERTAISSAMKRYAG